MTSKLLGEKMVAEQVVTKQRLREALGRQRLHGGRLGQNLVALGYLSEDQLSKFFHHIPPAPDSLAATGLNFEFIADLALKHILHIGEFRLSDLAERIGLPASMLDEIIEFLRREKLVEVRSASQFVKSSFRFIITETGKVRAGSKLMYIDLSKYQGKPTTEIVATMWNHRLEIHRALGKEGIPWPQFQKGEMAAILEFIRTPTE